jgi:hypothetical protein
VVKQSATVAQRQELAGHHQAAQLSAAPLKSSDRANIMLQEILDCPTQPRRELMDKVFVKSGMVSTSENSKVIAPCVFALHVCLVYARTTFCSFTPSPTNAFISENTV